MLRGQNEPNKRLSGGLHVTATDAVLSIMIYLYGRDAKQADPANILPPAFQESLRFSVFELQIAIDQLLTKNMSKFARNLAISISNRGTSDREQCMMYNPLWTQLILKVR